jgi:O-antigen/teichoic acid export membrane protein
LLTSTVEARPTSEPSPQPRPTPPPSTRHLPVGESVARGALALLSTQPLTWGASLLTTIAAPRLLGADELGQFTIATTIAALAATATSLGISEYLVRRFAQHPDTIRQDAGIALLVQTVATVVGAVAIAVLGTAGVVSLVEPRLLYLALLVMLNTPAQTVLLSSFRGRERHTQYAWFNAAGVVLGQVGGVLALLAGGDVLTYAAIVAAATIGSTAVAWRFSALRPTLPVPGQSVLRESAEFIRGGFPFLVWTLTLSIMASVDRVLLGLFVPTAVVGWYAAAVRVSSIPIFLPTLIMTPLFPALSRSVHEPGTIRHAITQAVRALLLLMVPCSAGAIVLAPAIPSLLGWPPDFDQASPLIALLSLQLPIIGVDMVFGAVLMAIGRQNRWVMVGIITALLKIALDFAVIPLFQGLTGNGAVGASMVSLVMELVMFLGALLLIPKHMLDLRMAWDIGRIALAGALVVGVGTILLNLGLVAAVLGGAASYVAAALALRVLIVDDLRPFVGRLAAVLPARG